MHVQGLSRSIVNACDNVSQRSARQWRPARRTSGPAQTRNGLLGEFAQECLEPAERQLNRIKVRRVFWQVAKRRPHILDRVADSGGLVNIDVVDDDDIAAPERGNQALLDIGQDISAFMAPSNTIGATILS